jgi:hypothetical protein
MTYNIVPQLQQEYIDQKALFENQPAIIQRFLESQARLIADALLNKTRRVRFTLPDHLLTQLPQVRQPEAIAIAEKDRQITVGGFLQNDVRIKLIQRLSELERSTDQAVSVSAGLLRYTAAVHMIYDLLPSGRSVIYRPLEDELIPTIPVEDDAPESAITQAGDAIVEEGDGDSRGEVQTPFIPAARKFFLPQWVAFDQDGKILVSSDSEAEAHIQSMQRYVKILHQALSLAPYISANEEYQQKRYGILGQLINQGRLLANYRTAEMICEIKERVEKQSLNRGLSVSLSYFDDQSLVMEQSHLEIIPGGRIMFIPAFVVRACRGEEVKVAQDTRLNASTRRHLLTQLKNLETAFEPSHYNEKVLL